jgi:hypothetical protein
MNQQITFRVSLALGLLLAYERIDGNVGKLFLGILSGGAQSGLVLASTSAACIACHAARTRMTKPITGKTNLETLPDAHDPQDICTLLEMIPTLVEPAFS